MMTFRTSDGAKIKGPTARDVIKALRAVSRDPEPSLPQFMRAVATRVSRQTGNRIPTRSKAQFIAALERAGLLIRELK